MFSISIKTCYSKTVRQTNNLSFYQLLSACLYPSRELFGEDENTHHTLQIKERLIWSHVKSQPHSELHIIQFELFDFSFHYVFMYLLLSIFLLDKGALKILERYVQLEIKNVLRVAFNYRHIVHILSYQWQSKKKRIGKREKNSRKWSKGGLQSWSGARKRCSRGGGLHGAAPPHIPSLPVTAITMCGTG